MQPKSTILVNMVSNGKGWLTGCGLHGYSLVSVPFLNWSIQYSLFAFKFAHVRYRLRRQCKMPGESAYVAIYTHCYDHSRFKGYSCYYARNGSINPGVRTGSVNAGVRAGLINPRVRLDTVNPRVRVGPVNLW